MQPMKVTQLLLAFTAAISACAHAVAADTRVLDDRGSKLEVLMQLQATPSPSGAPKIAAQSKSPRLSQTSMGVVYNQSLRAKGMINGEITFAIKGVTPGAFPEAQYPGFRMLVKPNVYIVVTRSTDEFVQVYERLKGRSDVEWVEPNVQYVGTAESAQSVLDAARGGISSK